jgi:DNA-binding beta-propeller fold protein YncE
MTCTDLIGVTVRRGPRASLYACRVCVRALLPGLVAIAALLLCAAGSSAAEGTTHTLAGQITPQGACTFEEPTMTAVNDETGEVYVYNRGDNALDRFGPAAGSSPTEPKYACLGRQRAGKALVGEEGNEGLAVDNSPNSPAKGTVYVVAPEEHAILRFKPTGTVFKFAGKIKKVKSKVAGETYEQEEFETIDGIAVDGQGRLWVDQGEKALSFAPGTSELAALPLEVFGNCPPRPGFAVSSNGKYLYVGRERENREGGCEEATAIMRVSSTTGESGAPLTYKYQYEREPNSGVAVDAASGEVYFGNVTNISVFGGEETFEHNTDPFVSGTFLERFGALERDAGVAIDSANGEVFATDAQKDQPESGEGLIDVYALTPTKRTPPTPTAELPDHRRWELVSPVNKHGSLIKAPSYDSGLDRAAQDGSAITYTSSGPLVADPPSSRAPEPSVDLSRREGGTWSTQDLGTPRGSEAIGAQTLSGTEYKDFSSDLSVALVDPMMGITPDPHEPPLSQGATETTPYLRDLRSPIACEPTPSGCYQALVSPLDDATTTPFGGELYVEAGTPDLRHVLLLSNVPLTDEGAVGPGGALYEWEYLPPAHEGAEAGGVLHRVSIAPPGEEAAATEPILGETPALESGVRASARHAFSDDGSRAFWAGAGHQLYARDVPRAETLRLDTPEAGSTPSESRAVFRIANAEGTRVFFTDGSRLTANATSDEADIEQGESNAETFDEDLYECELGEQGGRLSCIGGLNNLTASVASSTESASVQGVLGASEDGRTIYFVADGDLAPGAGTGHCGSESAEERQEEAEGKGGVLACSLYAEHLGPGGWEAPRFIARLTEQDRSDWSTVNPVEGLTSRVSPNGNFLAFMSSSDLAGYSTRDAVAGTPDEEVYLYDYATDRIVCASCNPTGQAPVGIFESGFENLTIDEAFTLRRHRLAATISGWNASNDHTGTYLARNLSNSGRLFFNGIDPLVPAATNGKADVYEYEPAGVGTCTNEPGCIALLSSGDSEQESAFVEAGEEGNDAFILTTSKLVASDTDSAYDIYDAHVCSESSPCSGAPPQAPQSTCETEAAEATCRAPSSIAPALPAVAPSTAAGGGNHGVLHEFEERKPTEKRLTRAQLLAKALKACSKQRRKRQRAACRRRAHRKYGAKRNARSRKRASGGGR